jgi:diguanylate cyclase (GGDEF)-like protein/PAS domain S-box-containing protein
MYIKSDGSIIDVNKTSVEKYGYSKEEFLHMNLQQLRHPSTMEDYEKQMKESASKGVVFECTHVKKNGTSFPVEVSSRTTEINGEMIRIHIIRDITTRMQSQEKINHLANYDALTDIPNRGLLMEQFDKTLEQAKREKSRFAVMIIDVDKFKLVNDIHGHIAGDEVLKKVAKRLQKAVRKADIIGRFGGDEFLAVQPFIKDKEEAVILASRILEYVAKPVKWNNVSIPVHISIGIAIFPEDSEDTQGLINNADSAMYYIKQKGGNAYRCYEAE